MVSPPKIIRTDNMGTITSQNSEGRSAQSPAEPKPLWEAAENETRLPFIRAHTTVSRLLL